MKFIRDNIKIITAFIMGMIISGFTVYAVTISSVNVEYDNSKSGLTSNNVEEAINELYGSASNKMAINTFGNALYAESMGARIANRSTSLQLSRGRYIVTASHETGSAITSRSASSSIAGEVLNLNCNSCNKLLISGRHKNATATAQAYSGYYLSANNIILNYFIEVLSDSDTISISYNVSANNKIGQSIALQAIPINQ